MGDSSKEGNWFWADKSSGEPQGRVEWKDLKQMARQGDLDQDSLVWKEGMEDWVKAGSVNDLFPAPPPLPESDDSSGPESSMDKPPSEPSQTNAEEKDDRFFGFIFMSSLFLLLLISLYLIAASISVYYDLSSYPTSDIGFLFLIPYSFQIFYIFFGSYFIYTTSRLFYAGGPRSSMIANFSVQSFLFLVFSCLYPILKFSSLLAMDKSDVASQDPFYVLFFLFTSLLLYYSFRKSYLYAQKFYPNSSSFKYIIHFVNFRPERILSLKYATYFLISCGISSIGCILLVYYSINSL
ncbi:hypothetical protein GGP85_003144 [Salinibacter ruber]|uniref:DUF4339 domain-containing protein n=1 Tax=Salinibacter ruber TaxID=146919 RepID=UPI00216910CE|nr:DUF4339 domain-containing protein [Salinibacter ruber]MCS3827674.1 hypothetical protein [Salinibacter ruber]